MTPRNGPRPHGQSPSHFPVLALLAVLALFHCPSALAGAAITIKLATLAPEGSTWYNGLREMAEEWGEISGGQVDFKIYPGGVVGNEGVMVRKMRIGQIHAAALTNLGILDIDPAPQVTNTPMLIESYDELDCVMAAMNPDFESRLLAKGFVVLNWGEAGWSYFFSKSPMRTPEDAAKIKVFAWEGDPGAVVAFRQAGFNPVVIASVDMIPSLQSGLIEGFPSTPLAALSLQWFALAPNMLDVPWAPLVGATVLSTKIWEQIPGEWHEPFLEAARKIGENLRSEVRRQDSKAVDVMKRYGLQVIEVDDSTRERWKQVAQSIYPTISSQVVPTDIFDKTVDVLQECRAGK